MHKKVFCRYSCLSVAEGNTRGAGVIVAVLDTGIDLTHPAFAGKLVPGYDFVDNDNNPSEVGSLRQGVYGHGTHVAGIIALTAPDAKIMPIRVLNSNGEGELWRITAAIIWAAQHGADIVNISFGYPDESNNRNAQRVLKDLIDDCEDGVTADGKHFPEIGTRRLMFVAGAGNSGDLRDPIDPNSFLKIFPAAQPLDGLLAVGASTRSELLAGFSSYDGQWVEVTAPGENIVSALPGGRYGMWSGTSMSAPVVSGIAALVKAKNPTFSPAMIVEQVKETSVDKRYADLRRGQVRLHRVDALCAVTNNLACPIPATPANNAGFEIYDLK